MPDTEFLWVQKYRPHKIDDCILPDRLKDLFRQQIKNKQIPNMVLSGGPGIGKTTVARALCEELGVNYMMINSSEDRGIDTLRTKIRNYASSMSFDGGYKVIILDEADGLTVDAQNAFRGAVEEYSGNCKFILTCNFKSKLIDAIHSRSTMIDFNLERKERAAMAGAFFKRMSVILTEEGIKHEKAVLAKIVEKFFPDYRRTINELQRFCSVTGELNTGTLAQMSSVRNVDELMKSLKDKNFKDMRKWIVANIDNDSAQILRSIFDEMNTYISDDTIPMACLIIAKYQYQAGMVADQEINMTACLTEMMVDCEFK